MVETKYIVITVFVAVYIFLLAFMGLAAAVYHKNHRTFLEVKKQYFHDWQQRRATLDITNLLQPLRLRFPLPPGETAYFFAAEAVAYQTVKKTREFKAFAKHHDTDEGELNFAALKISYRLVPNYHSPAAFKGKLFVTNWRILIEEASGYHQIPLGQVEKAYVSVIPVGGVYQRGIVVKTTDSLYQVVIDQPELSVVINELVSYNRFKAQEPLKDLSNDG